MADPTRVHTPGSATGGPDSREATDRAPARGAGLPPRALRHRETAAPAPAPEPRALAGGVRAVARLLRRNRVVRVWMLKAAIQKAISLGPASHRVNELFQRHVTGGVKLDDRFLDDRLTHLRNHLEGYREISGRPVPRSTLELGTGWFPVVPLGLYLAGADAVHTIDVAPLATADRVRATIDALVRLHRSGRLGEYAVARPERLFALEQLAREGEGLSGPAMLGRIGVRTVIADARELPLPGGAIDLLHSNNTLEHIPPVVLAGILTEFARVAAPGSVQSHFIDMSDHFAHLDRSITIYNHLRFSDRSWRLIDNAVQPQNRLRFGDYLRMWEELGLPVTREFHRPGDLEALAATPLHPRYRDRDPAELAVSHCHLYSLRPA